MYSCLSSLFLPIIVYHVLLLLLFLFHPENDSMSLLPFLVCHPLYCLFCYSSCLNTLVINYTYGMFSLNHVIQARALKRILPLLFGYLPEHLCLPAVVFTYLQKQCTIRSQPCLTANQFTKQLSDLICFFYKLN